MTDTTKYEQLRRLIVRRRNCTLFPAKRRLHPLEKRWLAQRDELDAKFFPQGRKKKPIEVTPEMREKHPEYKEQHLQFKQEAGRLSQIVVQMSQKLDSDIQSLAGELTPLITDEPMEVYSVSTGSFSTQGLGAEKYATCQAELVAESYRRLSVPVHVHKLDPELAGNEYRKDVTVVMANTDEVGKCIVEHHLIPLREILMFILKKGCNIRVFYPLLAYDVEEKLGIDAWGNDLREKAGG